MLAGDERTGGRISQFQRRATRPLPCRRRHSQQCRALGGDNINAARITPIPNRDISIKFRTFDYLTTCFGVVQQPDVATERLGWLPSLARYSFTAKADPKILLYR